MRTRVESSVNSFLGKHTWRPDLNKNQLRESLRKHIHDAPYLEAGVERIVDQVVNPKVYSVFMPQIEDVVYKYLGLERPKNRQRNGPSNFKDLLPVDLDPVSPESDKNSLKDISLDSVDAGIEITDTKDPEVSIPGDETNNQISREIPENLEKNNLTTDEKKSPNSESKCTLPANSTPNNSERIDEKAEEEEEDSPTFEPIDIMNLNESNISNDSHLSGISELTSHRSPSPDYSNDASRDNMDFSNQDSQFSKVSSDSRLSIVTDFGSSNHASTPQSDTNNKDKNDSKYSKENFKDVREFDSNRSNKNEKSSYETSTSKETTPSDFKVVKRNLSSKETSHDGADKSNENDYSKSKSKREKDEKERKKQSNHNDKFDKSTKNKSKEKSEISRDVIEKNKEKDSSRKPKEEIIVEKKEVNAVKEGKDLKDIYKEKIRELREKKELTEKVKLSKDKDTKLHKESKDKRDSSRDKKDSKDNKSWSKSSRRSDGKSSKSTEKDPKLEHSDSKDKKRDDRRAKDHKRPSRSEKDEKTNSKEKKIKNSDGQRETKDDVESKEKKRREEKKGKIKDDHSSLRKNTDDRRSTDRDGSNGSNGKSSQKSSSSFSATSEKPVTSSLSKESVNASNSNSETSDSLEESQIAKLRANDLQKINFDEDSQTKLLTVGQNEISLPLKKRPLLAEDEIIMKKPKFAKNFQEAKKLMKIRRRMEKEKLRRQLEIEKSWKINEPVETAPILEHKVEKIEKDDVKLVPDYERVQIIEVRDEECDEPYPEIQCDFTPEERSQIILGGETIFTSDLSASELKTKSTLSEMELSIRQSLAEMISDTKIDETHTPKSAEDSSKPETELKTEIKTRTEITNCFTEAFISEKTKEESPSSQFQAEIEKNTKKSSNFSIIETKTEKSLSNFAKIETSTEIEKSTSESEEFSAQIVETATNDGRNCTKDSKNVIKFDGIDIHDQVENEAKNSPQLKSDEKSLPLPESFVPLEPKNLGQLDEKFENFEIPEESSTLSCLVKEISVPVEPVTTKLCLQSKIAEGIVTSIEKHRATLSDDEPCRFFTVDNERFERFMNFVKCFGTEEKEEKKEKEGKEEKGAEVREEDEEGEFSSAESNEDRLIIDIPPSPQSKSMAPPKLKRQYSISPLTDILLNNTNNNNDATHKITGTISSGVEDSTHIVKKRKIGRPKKQGANTSVGNQQNLLNGENFIMPLSPESDVSATSEKNPTSTIKEEKRYISERV